MMRAQNVNGSDSGRRLKGWSSAGLLLALMAVPLFSQTERGNITGLIRDPTGAAVPGTEVVATNVATNIPSTTQANAAGEYNITVMPGVYRVVITAAGFKRYVLENVTVATASSVRVDVVLELGALSESVEVTSDVTQIQTETAKVSTAVQNRMVDELPLVVGGALRSPFDLAAITPESRGSGTAGQAIGGGQAGTWNATLDGLGVTNNRSVDLGEVVYNAPSVEAITEFTVDTNGFKAEYGQAGGGVMTFTSKSGTNEVHGVAYDFLRNQDLDARGFFAPTRSIYKQNDFGAALGGPIYIPKLYSGRNRTFFYVTYEGFRNRVGSNGSILSVPTPEMYQGDFSNWVNSSGSRMQIYDPATTQPNPSGSGSIRQPFPNNQIPASRFSTVAAQINTYAQTVKPNRGGAPGTIGYVQNNYISNSGSLTSPTNKFSTKVDHVIRNNHRLGFFFNITRYLQQPTAAGTPGLPEPLWNGSLTFYHTSLYRLSYDWTISPHLMNSLAIGGNTFFKNTYSANAAKNWKSKVCIPNVVDCNINFPQVSFSEYTGWGGASYNGSENPMISLKDDLSYIHGKHNLKFGVSYQYQREVGTGQQNIAGNVGFSFLGTSLPAATSQASGNSFASFLLGWTNTGATETNRYIPQIFPYYGFYAQDDWHLTPRLTVNLGVRYEFTLPPTSPEDIFSDFSPTTPNPAVNNYPGAVIFSGDGPGRQNKHALVPGWYGAIGPRLGIAYSLGSKTTIRSAFGRSFSKVTTPWGSGHYAGFVGSYSFSSADQDITAPFLLDKGLPSYPLPPQLDPSFSNNTSVDYWQGNNATRAPESISWTFSVQRQLTTNTLVEANYNATANSHLQAGEVNIDQTPTQYLNQFIQQYGATGALNLLRADITSALAQSAKIPIPYANFTNPSVQYVRTVAQALRPYPQYSTVATSGQGANGDKSGHGSYEALVLKVQRRFSGGLTFQWNYAVSKLLTDSDTSQANAGMAQDQYNRRLEKSIGQYDQTHALKLNTIYELPVGKGKKLLSGGGFTGSLLGGWRLGAVQSYLSGFPLALTENNPLSAIFNGATRPWITTYDGWRAPISGSKFDPNKDKFVNLAVFPAQPIGVFGNSTRYNPKLRGFPMFNENISLAKSFAITEKKHVDFRWEAFNLFNRTQFGNPVMNLNSSTFGVVSSQANTARQMQAALKLYW